MTTFLVTTPKSSNRTSVCSDCAEDSIIYCAAIREHPVPRISRLSFCENKAKTLVFNDWKWAFWACCRENCMGLFGHRNSRMQRRYTTANVVMQAINLWPVTDLARRKENLRKICVHGVLSALGIFGALKNLWTQKLTFRTNVAPWHARGTFWTRASYCK